MEGVGEFSGKICAGQYRLVRSLGDGAGRVHEARHDRTAGRFALKIFGDVDPRAFQRGAQRAAALRHEAIVRVVDYGDAPGRAFAVMEWAPGRSLAAVMAGGGALAPSTVARIVDSIALGLQAAHRQGLAHGDLTPERVLVLAAGGVAPGAARTKILGFGLGPRDVQRPGLDLTEVTPDTAPEQEAHGPSALADQFALAALAYELLTGVPPARGRRCASRPPRGRVREYDPGESALRSMR